MTPNDALSLLEKATALLKLDRNEHNAVIIALQVFQKTITDLAAAEKKLDYYAIDRTIKATHVE